MHIAIARHAVAPALAARPAPAWVHSVVSVSQREIGQELASFNVLEPYEAAIYSWSDASLFAFTNTTATEVL